MCKNKNNIFICLVFFYLEAGVNNVVCCTDPFTATYGASPQLFKSITVICATVTVNRVYQWQLGKALVPHEPVLDINKMDS